MYVCIYIYRYIHTQAYQNYLLIILLGRYQPHIGFHKRNYKKTVLVNYSIHVYTEFPTVRGPNADPNIVGLLLPGHPQKGTSNLIETAIYYYTILHYTILFSTQLYSAILYSTLLYLRASGSGRRPQRRMARLQISGHYAYPAVRSDLTPAPHFWPRATAAGSLH